MIVHMNSEYTGCIRPRQALRRVRRTLDPTLPISIRTHEARKNWRLGVCLRAMVKSIQNFSAQEAGNNLYRPSTEGFGTSYLISETP